MNYEKPLAHKIDFALGWLVCKLWSFVPLFKSSSGWQLCGHHRTQSGKKLEVIVTNETDKLEVKN
jgi:hypothetical protein